MKNRIITAFINWPSEVLVGLLIIYVLMLDRPSELLGPVGAVAVVFCACIQLIRIAVLRKVVNLETSRRVAREMADEGLNVNPWAYQAQLMYISDQKMGSYPQINREVLLYLALIMEEVGETMLGAARILEARSGDKSTRVFSLARDHATYGQCMMRWSRGLRHQIEHLTVELDAGILPKDQAKELLDGLTDIMVVTAGAGLASGLPVDVGYHQVASSNLSKANPVTGKIDKTPDGKWIKGANYQPPDFDAILDPHYFLADRKAERGGA